MCEVDSHGQVSWPYLTCSSRWYDDRWIFEGNSIKITDSGSSINDSSFLLSLFNACSRRGETCIEISFQITSRSALGGGKKKYYSSIMNEYLRKQYTPTSKFNWQWNAKWRMNLYLIRRPRIHNNAIMTSSGILEIFCISERKIFVTLIEDTRILYPPRINKIKRVYLNSNLLFRNSKRRRKKNNNNNSTVLLYIGKRET